MTSLALQGSVPNIYGTSVLKDLAQGFIDQSLGQIDDQQKIIRKVNVVVERSPFQKEIFENSYKYSCYAETETENEHCWNKPVDPTPETMEGVSQEDLPQLRAQWPAIFPTIRAFLDQQKAEYSDFLNHQKQVVKADISDDLERNWATLALSVQKFQQHGPLVYVEGRIKLQINTVDRANENLESTESYVADFDIYDQRAIALTNEL